MKTNSIKYVIVIILALVVQEVTFRLLFPMPELSNFDRINYMMVDSDKKFRHNRNQNFFWESQPDTNHQFLHKMNMYGFRDNNWKLEKAAGKKRVLLIGDSFVEGLMAEQHETIKAGFKSLDLNDEYEVLNAGMMGTGMNAYVKLITDMLPIFKPDYVVLILSSNDITNRKPKIPDYFLPEEFFNPWVPRAMELLFQISDESPVKFIGDTSPNPYLRSVSNSVAHPLNQNPALADHVDPLLLNYMKDGKFSPFRINNVLNEHNNYLRPPDFGELLPYLEFYFNKHDVKPVIAYLPSRNLLTTYYYQFDKKMCLVNCPPQLNLTIDKFRTHQDALLEECSKYNMPFINFTPFLRSFEQNNDHLFWKYDDHMNASGYMNTGMYLYDRMNQIYPEK